jgi:hypothetical protein
VGLGKTVQEKEGWAGAAMPQADCDFVGFYRGQRKSIEHDTLVVSLVARGEDLEAPCDPFALIIDQREYVLARVDVQRLLVKSVRFAQVSIIQVPINRGVATP